MKRRIIVLLAFFMFFGFQMAVASEGDLRWGKIFGGSGEDYGTSAQLTADGGFIITGWTSSYGAGSDDFWLIKADTDGNEVWNKTFGGSGQDIAYSTLQTADGGYIVFGFTHSFAASGCDFWLIKTDSNGNVQWDKTYDARLYDYGKTVQKTSDGGYILVGNTATPGTPTNGLVIKTDANGNEQWRRIIGGSNSTECNTIQQAADGCYILGGGIQTEGYHQILWLQKIDADGNDIWPMKTFVKHGLDDRAYSVQQTDDSGYIVAGSARGPDGYDAWLVKTDPNGNEEWNKSFDKDNDNAGDDIAISVRQTSDGGYILTGKTSPVAHSSGQDDLWLIKTDDLGNEEWNRTFGGGGDDVGWSVLQIPGAYIVLGTTAPSIIQNGQDDIYLIKVAGDPIEEIVKFIEDSVENGRLIAIGKGSKMGKKVKPPKGRINALISIFLAVGNFIEDEDIADACGQLDIAMAKTDGLYPPDSNPDFVAGPAAPELADMIVELMQDLGCE